MVSEGFHEYMGRLSSASSPEPLPAGGSSPGGGPPRSGNGLWLFGLRRTSPEAVMGGGPAGPAAVAAGPAGGASAPAGKARRGGTSRL